MGAEVGAEVGTEVEAPVPVEPEVEPVYFLNTIFSPWAASVYGTPLPELREIAEKLLREVLDEETELRWMKGNDSQDRGKVEVKELRLGEIEEWMDGSRTDEGAAGATRTKGMY